MAPSIRVRRTPIFFIIAGAIMLAFIAFSGSTTRAGDLPPGGTFADEDLNTHEGYIEAIVAEGITAGCAYQSYCPGDDVTRAQMASFLARALDLPASSKNWFPDDDGSSHESNINRVADAGITLGCGDGLYCPNDLVSRAQMASFLSRAFELPSSATNWFPDDNGNSHESNINRVADAGITLGCGNGDYCPFENVGRDQMASFLGRGLELDPQTPPYPVRALVSRFYEWRPDRDDINRYEVDDVHYYPRQATDGFRFTERSEDIIVNANTYEGWDILVPDSHWSDRTDSEFFHFFLSRPATVAVVWVDQWRDEPNWLNGWSLSGTVALEDHVANVYERSMSYGWQSIPGPARAAGEGARVPILLISEYTGSPTAAPPVPTGEETPVPNELCPLWVHDSHTTVAWDGETYGTWHPQIDPVYWCTFGHEHGSNPAQIPGAPFVGYQYVADKVPQDEPDMGFKEAIFRTSEGYWVRFIDHASTASGRRVCAQLHTMYAMVYSANGTELFRANFKLDFGAGRSADDNNLLNPSNCGYSMSTLAESDSSRRLRVTGDSNDYEQWNAFHTVEAANLGMFMNHEFDVRDPFTHCNGITCNTVAFHSADRHETGTRRVLDNSSHRGDMAFGMSTALASGTYYTDPYGVSLVASDAENATQQYRAPGFFLNIGSLEHCTAVEPWDMFYVCNNNLRVGDVDISRSLDPQGWMAKLEG